MASKYVRILRGAQVYCYLQHFTLTQKYQRSFTRSGGLFGECHVFVTHYMQTASGPASSGPAWSGSGLVGSGPVRATVDQSSLVWSGLVWSGPRQPRKPQRYCLRRMRRMHADTIVVDIYNKCLKLIRHTSEHGQHPRMTTGLLAGLGLARTAPCCPPVCFPRQLAIY